MSLLLTLNIFHCFGLYRLISVLVFNLMKIQGGRFAVVGGLM